MNSYKDQKILFISHDASMTGAPIFLLHLITWVKQNTDLSFRIILRNGGELVDNFFELGETYLLSSTDFNEQIKEGITLVYSNTITNGKFVKEKGLDAFPVITHVHELNTVLELFVNDALEEIKRQTDFFIACSTPVKENLMTSYAVEAERIHLVYEAIPTQDLINKISRHKKEDLKKIIGINEDDFVVIAGGTATERKGVDLFLQVAADYKKNYYSQIKCKFIWVGKLPEDERKSWYEYDKKRLGIDDIVAFAGQQNNPELFLFISDIFCLTSREDPFPLIMLEASLLGKPVIGFEKSGGVAEFCEKGTGFTVPYLDSSEMSKKIFEILGDRDLLADFSTKSPNIIKKQFDIEVSAKKILEIIKNCKSDIGNKKSKMYENDLQKPQKNLHIDQTISKKKFLLNDLITLSQNHLKNGNYFDAYWLIEKVLKTSPSNSEAQQLNNELLEKIKLKREEYGWNSKISTNNLITAEKNIEKGELTIAKNEIIKLLTFEPRHVEALNDLAVINIQENNFLDAKNIINMVLHIEPRNEIANGNLDYMLENKFINSKNDSSLFENIEITPEINTTKIEQGRQAWNNFDINLVREVSWLNIEEINNKRDFGKINFKIVNDVVKIINEVQFYHQNYKQKKITNDFFVNTTISKNTRKIKIGFLAADFFSACPFLRVTSVLYELQRQNQIEFINLIDLDKLQTLSKVNSIQDIIIVDNFKKLDIVIIQREFAVTVPFKELKSIIGNSKVKIVYEIDDNLINLYPAHPFYELYNSKKEYYIDYLKYSDLITVTTNSLREDFYKYNSKIAILPNYIDTGIWGNNYEVKKANKKIKILFSGSKTHLNDLMIIEDVIINIYSRFQEQVEFIFWGDLTEKIEKHCNVIKVSKHFNKYSDYAEQLKSLNIDIGLIPLKKNKFNASKSNIKWLDYSAAGIVSILSDVEAYSSSVVNGINGILVKNETTAWVKAIEDLIINPEKRERIAENAREVVLSQYSIQKNAAKWYLYYKNLVNTPQQDEIKVSVIIPTFNALDYTKKFIDSFYENQFDPTFVEIIIVDNNSLNCTKEYLSRLEKQKSNFRVIFNIDNLGFPAAVNQGFQTAKGKYILIANNDIIVTQGWLERLIEVAESDNRIGIVGPISNEVSGVQKDIEANYKTIDEMHLYATSVREKNKNKITQFPRVAFLCTLIKKEVIDKIGGLDERFSPGNFEDDDFCLRAQLAGYKTVIAHDVFIHHYGSKSFKADGEKKYIERLKTNHKIFVDKWGADPEQIWIQKKSFNHNRSLFISVNQDEFVKCFERAQKNIEDKEYDYAFSQLQNACLEFENSGKAVSIISKVDLYLLTANVALIVKDLESAKQYFEEALKLNPESSEACFGLGQVFYQAEMFEQSKVMLEWAVKNSPQNQTAVEALKSVNQTLLLPENHNSLFENSVEQVGAEK